MVERDIKRKAFRMRAVQFTNDIFEKDARYWGLTPGVAAAIVSIPILVVLGMANIVRLPDLYVWLTAEDSVLEWLQFLLVFTASLLFAWSTLRLFQNSQNKIAAL